MTAIAVPVLVFVAAVLLLSALVLAARRLLVPAVSVPVVVNGQRELSGQSGRRLLGVLADNGVYLPAACGGRGTCGQCRVQVAAGRRPLLPTEAAHISRRDAARGFRLACMFRLREATEITLPEGILDVRHFEATVASNRNVAPFLKELVLTLPAGESLGFRAGDYVLLTAPPYALKFSDFEIDEAYRPAWERLGLFSLESRADTPTTRAYSLGNAPSDSSRAVLVVRIAPPPPRAPRGTPPGLVSSYVFGLRPGDSVALAGPFGSFHAVESEREMVFIAGGAGIAPIRSMILDQLERGTGRRMSFWYGCRDSDDICYRDAFEAAAQAHENFDYHVALSQPRKGEPWDGYTGFIHTVVYEHYLARHPAPEEAEYYLCGPPVMSAAVVQMLEDLGVERDSIFFDDFGS